MIEKLLIIPDCHAHPNWSQERFEWLGEYIVDEQPDTIIQLGDFADMPSLSSYDRGKKSFEGRRYKRDCDATKDALNRLFGPLERYNEVRKQRKEKQYSPRTIILLGNHSARIERAVEEQPELDGTVGVEDLGFWPRFQEVYDFKEHVIIEDILFCHFLASGVMGRPIGGENQAASLLRKHYVSCVVGHSHTYDFAARTRGDGRKIFALVAGCYVHPDFIEGWCAQAAHLWWKGVFLLEGVSEGNFLRKQDVTQQWLMEKYG